MRQRIIKLFFAGKIFALLLATFQIVYFIAFSHLADFESLNRIQFLNLFRYESFIPSGFGPFMAWLAPHLLTFTVILAFFWWDWGEAPKWIAIGTVIGLTIMASIWFASIMILFEWIFLTYLVLRLPPTAIRKLFNLMRKKEKRQVELRKLVKKIPIWTQLFGIILILPLFIPAIPYIRGDIEPESPYSWNLTYNTGGLNFTERKEYVENETLLNNPNGFEAQLINLLRGDPVIESIILGGINFDKIAGLDGGDFQLQKAIRVLYLNNLTNMLSNATREFIEAAVLNGRFWVDQGGESTGIYTTENHQIGYHTAELLAGQMFRNNTFTRTLMTGEEHIAHAEHMINKWIDWRARLGFSEYYSNTYINVDFKPLMNLVDFAENSTLRLKAEMILDLLNFGFANTYFNDILAVPQGRMYGGARVANVWGSIQGRDSVSDAVWLWLGIGGIDGHTGDTEVFILTSNYTPSPILEKIANDSKDSIEHRERNGIDTEDGALYGIEYNEEDLMYWWGATGTLIPEIIETSFDFIETNDIDQAIVFGPGVMEYTRFAAKLRGITLSEFAELMKEYTRGMALTTANMYVYRTPYYQLAGLQDYGKSGNSIQEIMWQGSLSNDAYVFTNAPGGFSWKGGPFMGGWKPRAVFSENMGIIQYDHSHEIIGGRLLAAGADSALNMFTGNRPRNHAYFPKWAFEEVVQKGRWTFGRENGGYIALFSKNPTFWANDYELVSLGKKNVWIVEMGSENEYSSFEDFISQIINADIKIKNTRGLGFEVSYDSPSQGLATVGWEGDFVVDGSVIDMDYERFENEYVNTADFNSTETIIEFGGERLTLNFENNTRLYEP